MRISCHLGRPSWWNGSTSMCSTLSPKDWQIRATLSTFSSPSVRPGIPYPLEDQKGPSRACKERVKEQFESYGFTVY